MRCPSCGEDIPYDGEHSSLAVDFAMLLRGEGRKSAANRARGDLGTRQWHALGQTSGIGPTETDGGSYRELKETAEPRDEARRTREGGR